MSRAALQTAFASILALLLGAAVAQWRRDFFAANSATPESADATSAEATRPLDPELVAAMRTEKGARHWLRLLAASEHATAAEMPALIRLAGDDAAAIRMLGARWAEIDPHHMFQSLYAEALLPEGSPLALPERLTLTSALFESWTKVDPAAVRKALDEVPEFSGRENFRMRAVSELMKNDPEQGLLAMREWKINNYLPDIKKLGEWAVRDPQAATAAVLKLPNTYVAAEAFEEIGKAWAQKSPDEALRFAATLPAGARKALAGAVIRRWAERDLASAIDFANAEPNAALRGTLGQSLVTAWGKTDPAAALGWSQENLRGNARTEAVENLIKAAAEKDVTSAADFVSNMEEGPSQTRAVGAVFEAWFNEKDQRTAAFEWLASVPDEQVRGAALERVQRNWMWKDPAGMKEFITGPQAKLAPQSLFDQVARHEAGKNPETALAWVNTLPADRIGSTRNTVFENWMRVRPESAQNYARELPSGEERRAAISSVTQHLVSRDETRTAAWYQSLPAADQQVAMMVIDQTALGSDRRAKLNAALKKK